MSILFYGCNIDDERNICCNDSVMKYRFYYKGIDRFSSNIYSMRYFLYDLNGDYISEMKNSGPLNELSLSCIPNGKYTIVAIANMGANVSLSGTSLNSVEKFLSLSVVENSDGFLRNSNSVFWGVKTFEHNGMNSFLTEMSCIYCRLRIRVVWEKMPEETENYEYRFSNLVCRYDLRPALADIVDGKLFPANTGELGKNSFYVPMYQMELESELLSFRYTDDIAPWFSLYCNGEPVIKWIDLGDAFRYWGWRPSITQMQDYRIKVTIKKDGTVSVGPYIEVGINDWIDGGSFS